MDSVVVVVVVVVRVAGRYHPGNLVALDVIPSHLGVGRGIHPFAAMSDRTRDGRTAKEQKEGGVRKKCEPAERGNAPFLNLVPKKHKQRIRLTSPLSLMAGG